MMYLLILLNNAMSVVQAFMYRIERKVKEIPIIRLLVPFCSKQFEHFQFILESIPLSVRLLGKVIIACCFQIVFENLL